MSSSEHVSWKLYRKSTQFHAFKWAHHLSCGCLTRHPLLQQKQISHRSQYMWQLQAWSIRLSPFFSDSPEEFKERILKWQYFRAALTPSLLCCLLISASQSTTFKSIKHMDTGSPRREKPTVNHLMWWWAFPSFSCYERQDRRPPVIATYLKRKAMKWPILKLSTFMFWKGTLLSFSFQFNI